MTAPAPGTGPAPAPVGTPPGQAPDGGQPQNTPATPPAPGAPAPKPAPADTDPQDVESLPPWAQKLIKDARADAAKHRTGAQTATQAAADAKAKQDAVLKALGLQPDGSEEPLTQEQINAKIAEAADEVWATKVENLVLRTEGVDVAALWDSRAFVNSLDPFADMDPRSAEFAKDVGAHIAKYIKDHPQYAAKPAGPARSGGDHPGGSAAPKVRPSLGAAVANKLQRGS